MDLADLRREYGERGLVEEELSASPMDQFQRWFDDAQRAGIEEANAMVLATADPDGRPSARVVLLKGLDESGFRFYTNYKSTKARELEANPRASLVFFWSGLERQVRVEGRVERTSAEVSDRYFATRPRESQLGAWASPQSRAVAGRGALDALLEETLARFPEGDEVPRPPHWGGYRLRPERIEFWQGRAARLHDRLVYRRDEGGSWRVERLAP